MLADDPADTFLRYQLALEREKEGDHERSLQGLAELTRDQPPYVPAFFMAGQQLVRLSRIDEARSMLRDGSMRPASRATPTPPAKWPSCSPNSARWGSRLSRSPAYRPQYWRSKSLPGQPHRDRLGNMSRELSPQVEQYLASVVAGGLFPSEEAALEAAIAALREKIEPIRPCQMSIWSLSSKASLLCAGRCRVFTDADWENLRQLARDSASSSQPGSH